MIAAAHPQPATACRHNDDEMSHVRMIAAAHPEPATTCRHNDDEMSHVRMIAVAHPEPANTCRPNDDQMSPSPPTPAHKRRRGSIDRPDHTLGLPPSPEDRDEPPPRAHALKQRTNTAP